VNLQTSEALGDVFVGLTHRAGLQPLASGGSVELAPVARLLGQGSNSKFDAAGIDTRERRPSAKHGLQIVTVGVLDPSQAIRSDGSDLRESATREIDTRRAPACVTAGFDSLSEGVAVAIAVSAI
jgi:hypothetical protein